MWGMRVRAEPIKGEVPPHNLRDAAYPGQLSVAEWAALPGITPETAPTAWQRGIKWRPDGCVQPSAWDPNCANFPKANKSDPPTIEPMYETDPFVLEAAYGCKLVANGGATAIEDYQRLVMSHLELGTPKALEFQFWTNTLGSRMQSLDSSATEITGLTSAATVVTGATIFDRQVGLAMAGSALANCGAGTQGMIHAPAFLVELWYGDGLLTIDDGGYLVTNVRRDRVVAGSGYPGTGPSGVAAITALQTWIFATGPVEVYLGDTMPLEQEVSEGLDRHTNDVVFRAERQALIRFDRCCKTAVLLDAAANGGG